MTAPSARDEILARIGTAALGAPAEIPRDYRRHGEHPAGAAELLDLFTDRLLDYKATVHRTGADRLAATLTSTLDGAGRILVPPGLTEALSLANGDLANGKLATGDLATGVLGAALDGATVDAAFDAHELDTFDTVLTTCAAAAAETGTIVLDASAGQGRRAVTLVPDRHVCVVRADQVVHTVPQLLARLDPRRPLTFISGPSATSDIELQRVEGVHGPRTLIVVLVAS